MRHPARLCKAFLTLVLCLSVFACLKMADTYQLVEGNKYQYELGIRVELLPVSSSTHPDVEAMLKQAIPKIVMSIHGNLHVEVNQLNHDGTAVIHLRAKDLDIQVKENGRKAYLSAFQTALEDGLHVLKMDEMGQVSLIDGPTLPRMGAYGRLAIIWDDTILHMFPVLRPGRLDQGRKWDDTWDSESSGFEEINAEKAKFNNVATFEVASVMENQGNRVAEIVTNVAADFSNSYQGRGFHGEHEEEVSVEGTAFFDTSAGWMSARKLERYEYYYVKETQTVPAGYGMTMEHSIEVEVEVIATVALKLKG